MKEINDSDVIRKNTVFQNKSLIFERNVSL